MDVVYNRDNAVGYWVEKQLGYEPGDLTLSVWYRALGVVDEENNLVCGVIYNNIRGPSVEMHIAATTPRWCSRKTLKHLFGFPFNQLGCRRVTGLIETGNRDCIRLVEKLGWQREGRIREAMPDGADIYVYGLLKSECRWIDDGVQGTQAA